MSKNIPLWYKLIYHWCRKRNPKGFGLTIPFIIGVEENMTIFQLLTEIKESRYDEKIILQWCNELNEYVLSLDDENYPTAKHLNGEKSLLYYDDEISSLKSFDEVIKFLEDEYYQIIENKTYSKNKLSKEWKEYTKVDNEFISEVKSVES